MKLIGIADTHLGTKPSLGIDDTGRDVFLRRMVILAEEIDKIATNYNADAIVIAGDIYDTAVLTPQVADAADEIIRALSEDIPLILTPGQHDAATKTPELFPYHTHLSRFKNYPNVVLGDRFTIVDIKGKKICVAPWNPEHSLPVEAEGDIFVGHGAVQGCKNLEGYRFNSGFTQDELFKRFRLSIIGDIHSGQVFNSTNGSKILIPGTPVQFNFKDNPVCGIWLCDVLDEGEVTCEFISSDSICPGTFPKYLITDNAEKKSSSLVHYRYRPSKTETPQKKASPQFTKDTSSITEMGLAIIKQSKIDNQDLVLSIFPKLMESLSSPDRKVPRSRLHSIEIHNFLSVNDFQLDFKEFPDNLVITGKNGSGKSSLVEAIYWCLTGANTKGIPVSNVRNWYGQSGAWVEVVLEVEDVLYKIGRGRTDLGPQLQIFMFTTSWTPYTGSKTAATQDVIYDLLGISEWEIKLLSYFPASNPSLFGSIGKSDRYSLLSTIVGMSTVDAARDKLAELIKNLSVEISSVESRASTLSEVVRNAKTKMGDLLAKRDSQISTDTRDLERRQAEIRDTLRMLVPSSKLRDRIGLCYAKSSTITIDKTDLQTKIDNIRRTTENIQKNIGVKIQNLAVALEGTCPTCGQTLPNEDTVNDLTVEIENLRSKLPDARLESTLLARLAEKGVEQQANDMSIAVLTAEAEKVRGLETELQHVTAGIAKAREGLIDYGPLIQAEIENVEKYSGEVTQEQARLDTLLRLQNAQNWVHKTLLKRNGLLISELAKQGMKLLQDQVDYLTTGEEFSVTIQDDLSISASFLGRQLADYSQLSTGQARIIDIIMMCSLNNLFTQMYHMEHGVLGLVIFDEVLSFLDPIYLDYCFGLINQVNVPKRIVISHDLALIAKFNNEISVTLEGASSSIYRKNWS